MRPFISISFIVFEVSQLIIEIERLMSVKRNPGMGFTSFEFKAALNYIYANAIFIYELIAHFDY